MGVTFLTEGCAFLREVGLTFPERCFLWNAGNLWTRIVLRPSYGLFRRKVMPTLTRKFVEEGAGHR